MNVMIKKQFSFYFAIVVLFGLLETAPAQNLIIRDSGCLYGVEGSCVPRRTTYGYYETHWRNWPFAQKPKVTGDRQKRSSPPTVATAGPGIEVPRSMSWLRSRFGMILFLGRVCLFRGRRWGKRVGKQL